MTDLTPTRRLAPTPAWLIFGLLIAEGLLWLSERYGWFWFNERKGWTVLIAVASVGVAMIVMLVWPAVSFVFRLRFQFSIRSLLVLVIAVALPFSWLAVEMKEAGKQHEAVEIIRTRGGRGHADVSYDDQVADDGIFFTADARIWRWLREVLGDDFFDDVSVAIDQMRDSESVTDDDLECLSALRQLKSLSIGFCPKVTDAGMQHLSGLTQLKHLTLFSSNITDAGLKPIEGLTQLEDLRVVCILSDTGLEHLKRLNRLKTLHVNCKHLIGEGFIHLKGLTQLETLELVDFDMPEPHSIPLKQIAQLTQIRSLKLNCHRYTAVDVKTLDQAMPNCKVQWIGGVLDTAI